MRLRRYRWFLALCALLASASAAHAEGNGIKLGDRLLLHLGLAAEFRWDSNVFFQNSGETRAFLFRLLPTVDLATRTARDGSHIVDFRLHAGMAYNEFITTDASLAQHRSFGVDAGALLTLYPQGRVALDMFDNYARTTQPPYSNVPYNLDRDTNQLGARLRWAPGGRRLTMGLSYVFGLDYFEFQQAQPALQDFNVLYHTVELNVAWKFIPKTAIFIDASESIYRYQNHGVFNHPDSYPLHVSAGIVGLITVKLTVNAYIGYGNGFYVSGPSPNTAVGALSLNWRPTLTSNVTIGYKHDFANSLLGSYYDVDSAFLAWTQLIWRITGSARLGYQNQRYQGVQSLTAVFPSGTRTDNNVQFDLRLDYPFKNWLIGSVGYDLQFNTTDSHLCPATMPNCGAMPTALPGLVPLGYLVNEVWLRLGVLY
jgi:hypothetical protein